VSVPAPGAAHAVARRPYTAPFADLRATDLPLVGGKGANLGELLHAGFAVPDGFCVTTDAFARFVETAPDWSGLLAALGALDVDDVAAVREVGARVRGALTVLAVPDDVASDVDRSWTALGSDAAYAVRSSATAEDLPGASFAGQQDTFLNVRGATALQGAIQRCWISLYTDRAIVYRARNGFAPDEVRLAVVVQSMVAAEVSGVLFTADPVTQHRATLVIDAVAGLGEALVGGHVAPDAYRVDRRALRVLERTIGERAEGGTVPLLTDERVQELARMGSEVEAHFGTPQDVEWSIADGRVHVLQARPITSLYPIDALRSPDGSLHVYFSMGHQQSMTRALTPLGRSTGMALLRHPLGRRVALTMLGQLEALAPDAVRAAMARPGFRARPRPRLTLGQVRMLAGIAGRVVASLGWRDLTGFRERTEAHMDAFEQEVRGRIRAAEPGRARAEAAWRAGSSVFPFIVEFMPVVGAGVMATRALTRIARDLLAPDELEALTLAVPGNVVNEMNLAIDDLVEMARRSLELGRRFDDLGDDAWGWLAATAAVDGGAEFVAAFRVFLDRFGARAASEIDLATPRFRDDPAPILEVMAASLHGAGPPYRARVTGQEAARAAAYERLVAASRRGLLGPLRVRAVRRLYCTMLAVGGMREHHKFLAMRVFAAIREAVTEIADALVADGVLDAADDVWYLQWPELVAAWDGGDLRARSARAREVYARDQRLTPPLIVTSDCEVPSVRYRRDKAPEGALLGNPVSAGVMEGVVRVVTDPARDRLAPGEVLVAEFTDPGWTPLFINAAGLVLEVGGALTHGAVVAREYGIPAVVGVREATVALHTGQRVRVDGDRGIVEVLDGG